MTPRDHESDDLSPNELYRMIVRNESSISNLIMLREKDLTTIKDDRHTLVSRITNQISSSELKLMDHAEKLGRVTELSINTAAIHAQLLLHTDRLARFEEKLNVVSGMGGKGLSILTTALVGLVMGILGAWLTGKVH